MKHARISVECAAEVSAYQELSPAKKQKRCPSWRIGRELFLQVLDAICVKSLAKAFLSSFLTDFVSSTKLLEDVSVRIRDIYSEYHVAENTSARADLQQDIDPTGALDVDDLLSGGAVKLVEKVCEHGRHGYYGHVNADLHENMNPSARVAQHPRGMAAGGLKSVFLCFHFCGIY